MRDEEREFVEGMGQHMVGWGLPRTIGRVYAYLLLRPEAVSLDDLAAALQVAKSGASVAARALVSLGMARTVSEPGTKRLRYEPLADLDAIFAARNAQLRDLRQRFRQGQEAASGPASDRLANLGATLDAFTAEMPAIVSRLRPAR